MIDVHCHGVFAVDDGAKTFEESKKMIAYAYEQGVRTIIMTPHSNHPMDFGLSIADDVIENNFSLLDSWTKEKYPNMSLVLGRENYIKRGNIGRLHNYIFHPIGTTNIVLVEFSRDISTRAMDQALHEIKLLGYKPLIAHIEVYNLIMKDMESNKGDLIATWIADGIMVQVNGDNILEKSIMGKRTKKLIQSGLVHIVGSDAHNLTTRPCNLNSAYKHIRKNYGEAMADCLFIDNGVRLLNNEPLHTIRPAKITRKKVHMVANVLVLQMALLLVIALPFQGNEKSKDSITAFAEKKQIDKETTEDVTISEVELNDSNQYANETNEENTEVNIETTEVSIEDKEETDNNLDSDLEKEAIEEENIDLLPENEIEKVSGEVTSSSMEEQISSPYISYLEGLQQEYMSEVNSYYVQLADLANWEEGPEQEREANRILSEIGTCESQADNKVYKALYDLQNDLEAENCDISIVQEIRDTYTQTKVNVSSGYENKLRSLIN